MFFLFPFCAGKGVKECEFLRVFYGVLGCFLVFFEGGYGFFAVFFLKFWGVSFVF